MICAQDSPNVFILLSYLLLVVVVLVVLIVLFKSFFKLCQQGSKAPPNSEQWVCVENKGFVVPSSRCPFSNSSFLSTEAKEDYPPPLYLSCSIHLSIHIPVCHSQLGKPAPKYM